MRINNNMMAMNTHRQLGIGNANGSKSMEKLSSGFRINRAGDDAAGLSISEKMRGQIRGLTQASRNAQDGISLVQTAEGALNETQAILQRMRELAVQSATDTNTADDRSKIQAEVDQLATEITRISNTTEFNTRNLLAGGLDTTFHIGANEGQNVNTSIGAMDAFSLGVAASSISTNLTPSNGVTSISQVSEDLGTGAKVTVSNVVNANHTVNADDIVGAVTSTGSAYTGAAGQTIHYSITATTDVGAGVMRVDTIQLSTDGGTTFTGATINVNSGDFDLGNGVVIQIANDAGNANAQKGSITVTPKTVDLQLSNNNGNIGSVQTVNSGQTSVTLGSNTTGQTGTVSFNFAALTAGVVAVNQTIIGSTAATTDANGNVAQKATVQKGINVSTQSAADSAITTINNALEKVSSERSKLGAMQNRLEHTIKNLDTSSENLQASESRIRDVDMAKEMMEFTKNNILQQAAQAMLAQANQAPQGVLQLLR